MLDKKGFDLWADDYDKQVGLADEENTYPFAGYRKVLGRIYESIMEKRYATVLDIGFGTATLTAKLYENGCVVYGQDFSEKMIEIASEKMPEAYLYQGDFSQGLVGPLSKQNYDCIVATYSLHHLTEEGKITFLDTLLERLNEGGMILIGDVMFEDREALKRCREEAGEEWDDEEIYIVVDEMKESFPALRFEKISFCSGIVTLPGSTPVTKERSV